MERSGYNMHPEMATPASGTGMSGMLRTFILNIKMFYWH